jgi:uncharacterized membrane protein
MKSQTVQSRKLGPGQKIGWAFLLLLAIFPVVVSSGYLSMDPENFFEQQRAVYVAHLAMLMTHIVGSMLAILIGPFQFLPGLRKGRWLRVHRWLGRTYLLSILFGGVGGLYMAQFAHGGIISRVGFGVLASLWLYSGYRAYQHIRNKDIEAHRQWMIRNYALTFAGVMLRIWVPVTAGIGADFTTAYLIIAWACWVPNLLVAQWIIRRTRPAGRRATVLAQHEAPRAAQTDLSYEGD